MKKAGQSFGGVQPAGASAPAGFFVSQHLTSCPPTRAQPGRRGSSRMASARRAGKLPDMIGYINLAHDGEAVSGGSVGGSDRSSAAAVEGAEASRPTGE